MNKNEKKHFKHSIQILRLLEPFLRYFISFQIAVLVAILEEWLESALKHMTETSLQKSLYVSNKRYCPHCVRQSNGLAYWNSSSYFLSWCQIEAFR